MKILNYVSLILLWSSTPLSVSANFSPFVKVEGYSDVAGTTVELKRELTPQVEVYGTVPGCHGSMAAFMSQEFICRSTKVPDCSRLPDDQRISAFSMMGWAKKNSPEKPDIAASSYTNLTFGGSGVNALLNSKVTFRFKPESCYPLSKINNKFGSSKEFLDRMAKMQDLYLRNKNQTQACESCLIESISADLSISVDPEGLKAALQKDTFEEFLYRLVFKDCSKSVTSEPKPEVAIFPLKGQVVKKNQILDKITEVLTVDNPVLFEGVCLKKTGNNTCPEGTHSMVLTGRKKVCKGSDCKTLLKVQNPWGDDWQKAYDGGWVDAETLVSAIAEEPVVPGVLSWYL